TAAFTACSTFASSSTTKGLLPPNSSATFLSDGPLVAILPMFLPAGVEPVQETMEGTGCATNASTISAPAPTTTLSTPAGRPASAKIRPNNKPPVTGVSLAGLITTALPKASAGATERCDKCSGKFQGLMTLTTPKGLRQTTF